MFHCGIGLVVKYVKLWQRQQISKNLEATTWGVLWKKMFLEISQYLLENTCQSLFFNKVAGLVPATLLKKRPKPRCFPVNFAKFVRTRFYRTPLDDCLWTFNDNIKVDFLWLSSRHWRSLQALAWLEKLRICLHISYKLHNDVLRSR